MTTPNSTNATSNSEVQKPPSRKQYYGKYLIGVGITGGSLLLATQTSNLMLTIITLSAYGSWCLYYIGVKEPKRRQKFEELRNAE